MTAQVFAEATKLIAVFEGDVLMRRIVNSITRNGLELKVPELKLDSPGLLQASTCWIMISSASPCSISAARWGSSGQSLSPIRRLVWQRCLDAWYDKEKWLKDRLSNEARPVMLSTSPWRAQWHGHKYDSTTKTPESWYYVYESITDDVKLY